MPCRWRRQPRKWVECPLSVFGTMDIRVRKSIQVVVFVVVVYLVYKVLEWLFYSFFALTKMM